MFKNKQGVSEIEMTGKTHCFCPMGDDYYTAEVRIYVFQPKTIPDYCDVTAYLEELDGKNLIIEDLCKKVFRFISKQVGKKHGITVEVKVDDARHLPASVTIDK